MRIDAVADDAKGVRRPPGDEGLNEDISRSEIVAENWRRLRCDGAGVFRWSKLLSHRHLR